MRNSAVHFVGISGIGMSALARILLQRGATVSGSSDRATALTEQLAREGAHVCIGHDADHVTGAQTVVTSSAIAPDNPEVVAAHAGGLDVVRRGALLARLMATRRGIAIAGTHGKTTTTAMVAAVLEAGELDPTIVLGGERNDSGTNARDGAGEWFIAEADESDLSFLDLRPELAVVTNIENDHVANDAELARLLLAFDAFGDTLPAHGLLLVGVDEPRAAGLAARPRSARTKTFGVAENADVRAAGVRFVGFGSRFEAVVDGERLGDLALAVPGAINVQNALPALALGLELGVPFATIAHALATFGGVRRRFDILARTERLTVVDDYAHHPTAVAATIAAARAAFDGPIVVVFQPHRYTRTQYLAAAFARALRAADRVVVTDVYAASEDPLPGVNASSIGEPLAALGGEVAYVPNVGAVPAYLLAHAPSGALVLMLGAGSISEAAATLANELSAAPAAGTLTPR